MVTLFLWIPPYSWYCRKLHEQNRTEFHSRNVPLGLQEHQKGIRPKWNGRNGVPGIPQNGGSRIKGIKKGMHNLAAAEEVDTMVPGVWCALWALCLLPKQKTSSDTIPLIGILWEVSGGEIEIIHPRPNHFEVNLLGRQKVRIWSGLGWVIIGPRVQISLQPSVSGWGMAGSFSARGQPDCPTNAQKNILRPLQCLPVLIVSSRIKILRFISIYLFLTCHSISAAWLAA